jgi:hypothetical protein
MIISLSDISNKGSTEPMPSKDISVRESSESVARRINVCDPESRVFVLEDGACIDGDCMVGRGMGRL